MIWIIENLSEEEKEYLRNLGSYRRHSSQDKDTLDTVNFDDITYGLITDDISELGSYLHDREAGVIRSDYEELDIYCAIHENLSVSISCSLDSIIEQHIIEHNWENLLNIDWEEAIRLKKGKHRQQPIRIIEKLAKSEKEYFSSLGPFCIYSEQKGKGNKHFESNFRGIEYDGKGKSKLQLVHFDNLKEGLISRNYLESVFLIWAFGEINIYPIDWEIDAYYRSHRDKNNGHIALNLYAYIEHCLDVNCMELLEAIDWQEVKRLKTENL